MILMKGVLKVDKAPILTDREIWYILQDSRTCTYQNRMKLVAESQRDADQVIIDRQKAEIEKLKQEIVDLKAKSVLEEERVKKWKREGCEHNPAGSDGEPLVLKGDCPECWNEFIEEPAKQKYKEFQSLNPEYKDLTWEDLTEPLKQMFRNEVDKEGKQ